MKIKLYIVPLCCSLLWPAYCSAQYLNGEWSLKSTSCSSKTDTSATKVLTFFAPLSPPELVITFTDKDMIITDTGGTNAKECTYEYYPKKGSIHVICKDGPTDFKMETLNRDIILTDDVDHICIKLRRKKQFLNGRSSPLVKHPTPVP